VGLGSGHKHRTEYNRDRVPSESIGSEGDEKDPFLIHFLRFSPTGIIRARSSPASYWLATRVPNITLSTSKPHSLYPEDGGSMALRNVGILPHQYTASQPKRRPEN